MRRTMGGGGRVDYQDVLVLRAFQIADRGVAAHILPSLKRGPFDSSDFAAGVPGVEVIHDIFQNHQHLIVFVSGVHPIIEGDEPAAEAGENNVRILAAFDIISAKTTEVLAEYQIDFSGGGVSDKLIEPGPIEGRTQDPIVTVGGVEVPALFLDIAAEHLPLVLHGHGLAGSLVLPAEPAINSNIVSFLHL